MSKSDAGNSKKERNKTVRWVTSIFFVTLLVSGVISLVSDAIMARSHIAVAFFILLMIVFIGIVFDVIGVAVTSAHEKPFHSMAARKVRGAQQAIRLLRNTERVSSICNDVIGDICGVISGSASATIAVQVLRGFDFTFPQLITLLMSALVAGLTVGGKALGKTFAIGHSTEIVLKVGRFIWGLEHIPELLKKKKS